MFEETFDGAKGFHVHCHALSLPTPNGKFYLIFFLNRTPQFSGVDFD